MSRFDKNHRQKNENVKNDRQAQIPFGSSRLDTTRLDMFDVSSPYILPVSSLSNSTARHAQHDELDLLDATSSTCSTRNLVRCVFCIKLWYVSYSLIYWRVHLFNFIPLDGTNRICVCKSIKTTKLVQASTMVFFIFFYIFHHYIVTSIGTSIDGRLSFWFCLHLCE